MKSTLHTGEESGSLAFDEFEAKDWAFEVNRIDLVGHENKLYKKLAYAM